VGPGSGSIGPRKQKAGGTPALPVWPLGGADAVVPIIALPETSVTPLLVPRSAMKPSGLPLLAILGVGFSTGLSADATSPVDYTQRNDPYAPAAGVTPKKQAPETNATVQEKRVDKTVIERKVAPVGERRSPVDITETREKQVREKDSRRPEKIEQPTSAYNHRPAAISTEANTRKPPTVAKYQDSIAAASATNMARFPAVDRATTAKVNRFVFRKNPSESSSVAGSSPVIPAAGGGVLQK